MTELFEEISLRGWVPGHSTAPLILGIERIAERRELGRVGIGGAQEVDDIGWQHLAPVAVAALAKKQTILICQLAHLANVAAFHRPLDPIA
jgi:hypothetical protein